MRAILNAPQHSNLFSRWVGGWVGVLQAFDWCVCGGGGAVRIKDGINRYAVFLSNPFLD